MPSDTLVFAVAALWVLFVFVAMALFIGGSNSHHGRPR